MRACAAAAPPRAPSRCRRVASINLCADQHVLALADPEQILTVSWLAADPEESLFAAEAARHHAELRHGRGAARVRSRRRDRRHVYEPVHARAAAAARLPRRRARARELPSPTSSATCGSSRQPSARPSAASELVAALRARMRAHRGEPTRRTALAAVVVRPGGFTVGAALARRRAACSSRGVRNVAAEQGLDRWGSLSMEALLRSAPELIVLTGYRSTQPSLANAVLEHPALRAARAPSGARRRCRRRYGRAVCRAASSRAALLQRATQR